LSGDETTRKRYLRDVGENAAVAINDSGAVVEVHDSGSGSLWYWTGQLQSDGSIEWKRHGRYDNGEDPAVTLRNDGWLVAVHKSENHATLWYRVAHLGVDYELTWGDSHQYDDGVSPTIRFDSLSSSGLREIHTSENHANERWDWEASLDTSTWQLQMGDHGPTSDLSWTEDHATSNAGTVLVWSGSDGSGNTDTLLYSTGMVSQGWIRYPQRMFTEYQDGDPAELLQPDTRFFALEHGDPDLADEWERAGHVVRVWSFSESDFAPSLVPPGFPATDTPSATWYQGFCDTVGAVQ
jgi:hypothetical protein